MRNRLRASCAALALLVTISTSACLGSGTPPPNLYTTNQARIYNTETAEQAVIAMSQSAIAFNANKTLSDADTRLVRDFALAFDSWRASYASGAGTLAQITASFTQLNKNLSTDATSNTLKAILATIQLTLAGIPPGV